MLTTINLCNIPFLDMSYTNVIDFESRSKQKSYFESKTLKTIDANIKYDNRRTYINVDMPLYQVNNYDYLWFKDSNDNRYYYYFIVDIEVCTQRTTNIFIELDVFNTYYYDCILEDSFVDRCHVPRWDGDIPTYNLEDEGLSIGEYVIQTDATMICEMEKSLVVATSVPVGITEQSSGVGSGTIGYYGGTSWKDGKVSSTGFRFIKGYEGFAAYSYTDSVGINTIGYGVAQHANPTLYAELYAEQPITEEKAARVMYDLLTNNYSGKILDTCLDIGITEQYQFDALSSLAYNSGCGSITGDNTLMQAIAKDPTDEASIRPLWESFKTNGGLSGLIARRSEECDMFFGISVTPRAIVTITETGGYGEAVTENEGNGWLPQDDSYLNDGGGEYNGHKVVSNDLGSNWLIPVSGATVSSPYGWRNCPFHGKEMHAGVDLACPKGTPILAPMSGYVEQTGYHASMGNYIYLKHGTIITKYMHLSKVDVTLGQTVYRTDKIGEVGTTGSSTGNHLHWEFRDENNESCNPIPGHKSGDTY